MNASPRSLLAGHRTRLAALVLAASCAAVLALASCGSAASSGAADHHCADLVAKAVTTTNAVPGMWNCLDQSFQTKLNETGSPAKGQDSVLSVGIALSATYIGGSSDYATYALLLSPNFSTAAGTNRVVLVVWLDAGGKATNVGIATPAF